MIRKIVSLQSGRQKNSGASFSAVCAEMHRQVLHELPYVETKYIATDPDKWI